MERIPAYESDVVEFKSAFSKENIKKTIVAFANTYGGDLYIGVNDDGSICGLDDVHTVEEQLWNMVRDNIFPSIIGSVDAQRVQIDKKSVLHVHVSRGPNPPYSLAMDDPRYVYIRVGNTNAPAHLEDISRMVERKNPVPYEKRSSPVQDLTFEKCMEYCRRYDVEFDLKANTNFGFWDRSKEQWTNLAYICSDQCSTQMHLIRFKDDKMTLIAEAEKVSGSVFLIYERALSFIERFNLLEMDKADDGTMQRRNVYSVNPMAVREAVINQLVHRNYRREVPWHIHISPAKIEFWSPGGLHDVRPQELFEDMVTSCRNPGLAALFIRMQLMEGLGTGFRLIRSVYEGIAPEALIRVSADSLRVSLPRVRPLSGEGLNERQKRILENVISSGAVTRADVQRLEGISMVSAANLLREMVQKHFLVREGAGPRTRYRLSADAKSSVSEKSAA